jgi:enamine deaminase RidA (YjgF/YER057c/UK114 family)
MGPHGQAMPQRGKGGRLPRRTAPDSVPPTHSSPEAPMSAIETRLAELGVTLPDAPAPAANYVPFVITGNLVHISGQISANAGGQIKGRLGADMSVEQGAEAAKACAISLLAQLKKAVGGDFSRVVRAVKLVGFVNSTPEFTDQPKVINGASDFMVAALGDAGRHARSAVSAASLPFGVAVEIEGIFEIR